MEYKYNDGGRAEAGYKGYTGDCVVRAISIATEIPYQEVYDNLNEYIGSLRQTKRIKGNSSRTGISKKVSREYLKGLGWEWIPTMFIGSGCKVHLRKEELPTGTIIAKLSKHLVAIIDGVIQDTGDCSRNGTRCVYGYHQKVV